jgi:ATP-dependent Clp protease ATP-binding subunit ClpA/ATP-dependent Clp protease ATP-binding subunit ClpC
MREELRRLKGKIGYLHVKKRADRKQILSCLAQVRFLQRTLKNVHDIQSHAVMIELLHVGLTRRLPHFREIGASLMEALSFAYLQQRGDLEAWALRPAAREVEQGAQELDLQRLRQRPEQLVLKLVGLNVLDFFAGETGCHIWRSLSRGSDVIRVRVAPAPFDQVPADWIDEHARQTEAFQQALETGVPGPLPANPGALFPLVREYHYDPPSRPGHSAPLEIADFRLGYATTQRVRSLSEGLERIWLLRMGLAEEPAGTGVR